MAPNLQYISEEELGTERPRPQRLAIEAGIIAALSFLILKFGGFHHGANPLSDVYQFTWVSTLFTTTIITLLFVAFRIWRADMLSKSDEA